MATFQVTFEVNAEPQEAWEILNHWIGRTAPEEIVGFAVVEVEEGD